MNANSAQHALHTVLCYVRLTSGIPFSLLLEQGPITLRDLDFFACLFEGSDQETAYTCISIALEQINEHKLITSRTL